MRIVLPIPTLIRSPMKISISITDEDFDFDVPLWLFQGLEEVASPIQQEDDHLDIVFGSFHQDSDLDTVYVAPPIPIVPKIEGWTVKIGDITCSLAAFKNRNDDGSSFESEIATMFVDLESKIASRCVSDCISVCDNCMEDEGKMHLCKSTDPDSEKLLQKQIRCVSTGKQKHQDLVYHDSDAFGLETTVSPPEKTTEKATLIANDLVTMSLFSRDLDNELKNSQHYDLFNQTCEVDFVCAKSFPNPFVFNCSLFVWFDFIFTTTNRSSSFVEDGNKAASKESRRTQEVVLHKPPDLWPSELHYSCYWLSPLWHLFSSSEPPWDLLRCGFQTHDPGDVREASGLRLLCSLFINCANFGPVFILQICFGLATILGQNFGPSRLRPCLFGLG